jgi:soluble lytic murein transglycosylase
MTNGSLRGKQGTAAAWLVAVVLAAVSVLGGGPAAARHIVPIPKARPAMDAPASDSDNLVVAAAPVAAEPPPVTAPAVKQKSTGGMLPPLSPGDIAAYRAAFTAVAAGHYQVAQALAATGHVPVAAKLVTWLWLTRPDSAASFSQLTDFIAQNPTWPAQDALQRRVEESLAEIGDDGRIIAWFKTREPLTAQGQLRLAEALLHTGQTQEGTTRLRRAWLAGNFGQHEETEILKNYREFLRPEDHQARLDRLLWDEDRAAAKRMEPRVPEAYRALAEARMALFTFAPGVEGLVARVPAALRNDPGLAYDRVRWRRLKGLDDQAQEILAGVPADAPNADRWWVERQYQARRMLGNGDISAAYRIAAAHGDVDTRNMIDAEWLAGWIALRFLQERHLALTHFARIYGAVQTPVSRARGAYWAGRAAEALGDKAGAEHWYTSAADYSTTYYGQLAALRLGRSGALSLPPEPQPTPDDTATFKTQELVQAAHLLGSVGLDEKVRSFILRLNDLSRTPVSHRLVADLAERIGRIDLGVTSAKRSARNGVILVDRAFPMFQLPAYPGAPELPLVLAVSRQESEFNPQAVSNAGARGLMQLMPSTAKMVAKSMHVTYRPAMLTGDPAYSTLLGGRYLRNLLDNFGGSYVLALAAYNAGDVRVRKWMQDWGDPRRPEVDVIDWIELIPFAETRNYVQRVFEGLQVYRQRLNPQALVLSALDDDLHNRSRKESCNC